MSEPIISVSGLRGIVGESLTPEVALRYVAAFLPSLPPGAVVLARDGRTTGSMLASIIRGAVLAAGRNVIDAGIAATPTVGVLIRARAAAGGIQISASHNPPAYNGLKLFSAAGRVFTAADGQSVLARYHAGQTQWVGHEAIGDVLSEADPHGPHLQSVLGIADVPAVRQQAYTVLLDANAGSGSLLGVRLLEALGCRVVLLGGEPNGKFLHPPEPTAANLAGVAGDVVRAGAAVGFCQDPDADRLAIIDEQGRYLGEEYTLAICAAHVLSGRPGPLVINGSTSRMCVDLAARYGQTCRRSAVGEANVADAMLRTSAVFGGEGNGGPIDPRVGYVRDSFVGMALVLTAMAHRRLPVSRLASELPRYEIHKTSVTLPREKLSASLAALQQHFADAASDTSDGLRLEWPDSWLQVRGSNTEPIVRIIAEATTLAAARGLCDSAAKAIAAVG